MSLSVRITEMPKKIVAAGEAMEMFELLLSKAGCTGVWSARPISQIRWRDNDRFRVIRFDGAASRIMAKVRPAGADSAWEWALTPPSIVSAGTAYTKLLEVDGWDGHTTEAERNERKASAAKGAAEKNGHTEKNGHANGAPAVDFIGRLTAIQKEADRWASRAEQILAMEVQLQERMDALALAEADLNVLRAQHKKDEDGKRAFDAVQRLQKLLT